ncbi:MAG: YfdX family protein [Rhodocyclaceae bacterium]|nr:YfdX family protein [Rhodocyclaceae bacterium]
MKTASIVSTLRLPSMTAGALAVALAIGMAVPLARAADATPAKPAPAAVQQAPAPKVTATSSEADALMKFSQAGRDTIDSVRLARRELFDGKTDLAMQDMKLAQKSLLVAKAEAPSFASTTVVSVQGKVIGKDASNVTADIVPVGGDLVLADQFKPAPKHVPILEKARELFGKGDRKGAVDTLTKGKVEVSYLRQWMPIASSGKLIDQAISLSGDHKYYEANLALKAVEDGLQHDSVSFVEPMPAASGAAS